MRLTVDEWFSGEDEGNANGKRKQSRNNTQYKADGRSLQAAGGKGSRGGRRYRIQRWQAAGGKGARRGRRQAAKDPKDPETAGGIGARDGRRQAAKDPKDPRRQAAGGWRQRIQRIQRRQAAGGWRQRMIKRGDDSWFEIQRSS